MKWGVYAASFWLGVRLLGPVPGLSASALSLSAGPDVLVRLFVGSLIIAAVAAAISYVVALRVVRELRERDVRMSETLAEVLQE